MTELTRPSEAVIWGWLEQVPDPEIPVISVVDLGVVRAIAWDGDTLVITVTPTYSGCPATRVINDDIIEHLQSQGIDKVRTERQLSPAWTTAWLTESGREKLRDYGIAPPVEEGPGCTVANAASEAVEHPVQPGEHTILPAGSLVQPPGAPSVSCPRCGAGDAKRISQFGSTPCKASYQCSDCLEPFDYFKCH